MARLSNNLEAVFCTIGLARVEHATNRAAFENKPPTPKSTSLPSSCSCVVHCETNK